MWKEPRIHELDAPSEFKKLINTSIFYNSRGRLAGADQATIMQYVIALVISWGLAMGLIIGLTSFLIPEIPMIVHILFLFLTLLITSWWFYSWGWQLYEQAWYHIDQGNKLFTVIRKEKGQWETIEIPFEQVHQIEWSGGNNGYAIIHAAEFQFRTSRADTERFASVTEMWSTLAGFDTKMTNWPLILQCPQCNREFGHHIGTAQCPFDEMILIDPSVKGRIDPDDLHPDDYTRV